MSLTRFALVSLSALFVSQTAMARVIIDFSEPSRVEDAFLDQDQKDSILNSIFGNWVSDFDECHAGDSETVVAEVSMAAKGKFVSTSREQYVVTITTIPCDGGRAGATGYVALVQNGEVIANVEGPGKEIQLIADVDGDGLSEVVTTDGGTWQGITIQSAGTYTFKRGVAKSIDYVNGIVHTDNCGAEGRTRELTSVFFTRDDGSVLQKNYRKRCGAPNSEFKFYSNGSLDDET